MRRTIGFFGTALACLLASGAASADISYSFHTDLTPQGRIDGAMTVSDAAIADGSITINEVNANFVFSNVSAPFAPTTFTSAQFQFFSLNLASCTSIAPAD